MAGVYITSTLYLPDALIATVRSRVNRQPKGVAMQGLIDEINSLMLGVRRGNATVAISGVVASQTITCDQTQAVDNTDTLTIAGGTALATVAAPANENQVAKGASSAAYAANVVAKINAHSVHSKLVWAAVTTSATGIITIYSLYPGPIGNKLTLAEAGNGYTLGGATLANGTSDVTKYYQLGYDRTGHVAG